MPSDTDELNAILPLTVLEVRPDGAGPVEVAVPIERPLTVEVNGRPAATLMSLPGLERELAVGFCLSEGLIASFGDILVVHYCREEEDLQPSGGQGAVNVGKFAQGRRGRGRPTTERPAEHQRRAVVRLQARPAGVRGEGQGVRRVLSGCGSVEVNWETLELAALPLEEAPWLRPEAVWKMAAQLRALPGVYQRTGAVHGAGLYAADGTPLVQAEDLGRHNAMDKVLGAALIRGLLPAGRVVLTTGRASHEMVAKALRLGVPVVGSLSAPTSLAVELAERGRCTLLGRLRRQSFLVYAAATRVAAAERVLAGR